MFLPTAPAADPEQKTYVIPCLPSRAGIPDSVINVLSFMSFRTIFVTASNALSPKEKDRRQRQ